MPLDFLTDTFNFIDGYFIRITVSAIGFLPVKIIFF